MVGGGRGWEGAHFFVHDREGVQYVDGSVHGEVSIMWRGDIKYCRGVHQKVIGESCVFVPLQEASGGSVCGRSYVAIQRLARTHQ